MSDGQIRIRIGAIQDRSFDTVFGNVEKRISRLKETATRSLQGGGGGNALSRPMQQAAQAAEKASRDIEKSWNRELAQLNRIAKAQDAIFNKSARDRVKTEEKSARDRVKIEERANREIERSFREASRAADREARSQERSAEQSASRQERARERFASRVSNRATKFMFPPPIGFIGAGRRVAGDILRGAGIDFSVEGGVQRAIAMQSSTIQLANAERIATGQTRGAKGYDAIARSVGDKYSVGADKVQALMTAFSAKTGNYKDLDKIAPQLVSLAVASGSQNFGDVGEAAASAYNQLKDKPTAIPDMIGVMRGTLGQAAEGAIDPKDYAKHLGRIGAGAFKYEGDRGENILRLSALAQLAMERGATSPADAARSVGSFNSTFGKAARIKAFDKAGVNLFANANQDTFRNPFEIIKESFRATKGNIPQLATMFADTLGRKPIESLGAVYKGAGGGEGGIAAIQKEFDRYMGANLTKGVEDQNNKDYQESAAAKAAKFQNNLDKVTASLADKVLPALEAWAPIALKAAEASGGVIKFAADFPLAALAIAGAFAILRAALETTARAMLEKAVMRSGGGAGGGAGGAGMPAGVAGSVLRVGSSALLGAGIGGALGELGGDATGGSLVGGGLGALAAGGTLGAAGGAALGIGAAGYEAYKLHQESGGWDFWNASANQDEQARAQARAEGRQFFSSGGNRGALSPEEYDASMKQAKEQGMLDPVALSRSFSDGLAAQTLAVRIVNVGEFTKAVPPPVAVPPGGRQPPAGAP